MFNLDDDIKITNITASTVYSSSSIYVSWSIENNILKNSIINEPYTYIVKYKVIIIFI